MRFPKLALFAFLLSPVLLSPAFARGGGGHAGGGGVRGGFSGGGFRGGVVTRGFYRAPFYGPSVYLGVGGWNYPYYGYYGYDPYYGYPPYVYSDPAYSAQPAQPTQPQPQQPAEQVQPSSTSTQGNYYLIAFTDHSIQAATAYKVEGDQFHWIGRDGKERQVPLANVDIPFSQQMNRDRHVDLQIP